MCVLNYVTECQWLRHLSFPARIQGASHSERMWLQANPGKRLPKAKDLGRMIKFAKLADNKGTLQPNVAEMFQEACGEVRSALDPFQLNDDARR